MGAMRWFKVASEAASDEKVRRLRVQLGDTADAYVFRLWCYCAQKRPDGVFTGPECGLLIEAVVEWRGERGALVAAMLSVGLLDCGGESVVVHQWGEWQSAIVARAEKDRARKSARRISSGASAGPSSGASAGSPRGIPVDPPLELPLPSLLSVSAVSKGGAGENAPTPSARTSSSPPVAESLPERLQATFLRIRGAKLKIGPREENGVLRTLLALSDGDGDEVVRRFERGLKSHSFPKCRSLSDLATERCWSAYATDEPTPPEPQWAKEKRRTAPAQSSASDWEQARREREALGIKPMEPAADDGEEVPF